MIGWRYWAALCWMRIFGDPAWLPHPVVYMGKAISALEKCCVPACPKRRGWSCRAGRILAFCLPVGTFPLQALSAWAAAPAPAAGAGGADVLVRTGTGCKGACPGEHATFTGNWSSPTCLPPHGAVSRIVGRDTQA